MNGDALTWVAALAGGVGFLALVGFGGVIAYLQFRQQQAFVAAMQQQQQQQQQTMQQQQQQTMQQQQAFMTAMQDQMQDCQGKLVNMSETVTALQMQLHKGISSVAELDRQYHSCKQLLKEETEKVKTLNQTKSDLEYQIAFLKTQQDGRMPSRADDRSIPPPSHGDERYWNTDL